MSSTTLTDHPESDHHLHDATENATFGFWLYLMTFDNGLQIKLPSNFATNGINVVRITLTPADEYDVEFGKLRGLNYKVIETVEGVYCDMLQDVFTSATGLLTSL